VVKECPKCKLLCSPTALRCDCGFDLTAPPDASVTQRRPSARRAFLNAVILFLVAYAIQVVGVLSHVVLFDLLSLVVYGLSLFYLIRGIITWIGNKRT
jgi:hypothetical protein